MSLFKTVNLIQKTHTPGNYVEGDWIEGTVIENPFRGTAQPATGKVLEVLPEGKRNSEAITVFAPITLQFTPAEPREQRSGDIIVWENREYEIQVAKKYNSHPSKTMHHWELVATREKEGES